MSQTQTLDVGLEGLDALTGVDALCLFVAEDDRPLPSSAGYVDWRLCGALSRVLQGGFFTGVKDDWLLLPSDGKLPVPRIFVVGLGSRKRLDAASLGEALAGAAKVLSRAKVEAVALEVPQGASLSDSARAEAYQRQFLPAFKGGRVSLLADKGLVGSLSSRKG
ncbi:M17 family peptidase N-terminal domain-containing protein [Corallococcus carmarthensis]|uniref:Peptidase M17 n=1 Tax=Corallococcus carmarthensis TaxID=2316728 RepID=A0A3A8K039_9BACT|nr:M17 family peptidase N-terminal domain-containing protein [Corallococcus carmarthensis]NOK19915.1 peptidase M17 [Corallococcus carmarthensis]RKH01523.1 peptidase M17 [Corallococcus carmarthensis]